MALFHYKALALKGKKLRGVIDADSLVSAKERLRKQQLLITFISPLTRTKHSLRLSTQELIEFTRELSQLLNAGLPLYDSVLTIEEKQRSSKCHPLFADLCDKLHSGHKLSHILAHYPETFSKVYCSLVRSCEQSGSLADAFSQLYVLLAKQQKWKKQLLSTLSYPALLTLFCILVTFCLFFFVVPSMEELFVDRDLHPLTALVLATSRLLRAHTLLLGSTLGFLMLGLFTMIRAEWIQWNAILLRIPFIKNILLSNALVRFFRTMHMLLRGGIPFAEAIPFATSMIANTILRKQIEEITPRILSGQRISTAFGTSPLMPPLVLRMLHIGEEAGTIGPLLENLAKIYEEDLERDLSQLTTLLQPALLLMLGLIVGLVVLSIVLPLTDVSSFSMRTSYMRNFIV